MTVRNPVDYSALAIIHKGVVGFRVGALIGAIALPAFMEIPGRTIGWAVSDIPSPPKREGLLLTEGPIVSTFLPEEMAFGTAWVKDWPRELFGASWIHNGTCRQMPTELVHRRLSTVQ